MSEKLKIRFIESNKAPSKTKKSFRFLKINVFSGILSGLIVTGLFSAIFFVFALPYSPGETTNPSCSPTDTNCTVASSVPYTGATSNVDLGSKTLTTTGAGSLGSLSLTTTALTVGNGGTSNSSFTAYALLTGGTTATGALQQVSGVGTSGQVLTSNGAGALPTWQALSSGANTALSNLASVAINTALLPDAAAADDFGSATLPFKDLFFAGSSGTPGTNNFKITGASTSGTRTITFPDASGTVTLLGNTSTGSGSVVLATSPTLVAPTLGAATATTLNSLTITTSTGTLTITNAKTLSVSNTLTFTGTDSSSVAFGGGGTVAYTANKLSAFASTTSAELAGVISDETGSGALVFGTSPTIAGGSITGLTTLAIRDTSAGFDVTIAGTSSTALTADRKLTIDMINAARTIKLAGNIDIAGSFTTSGANALTLTTTGSTDVALPTTGTLSTLAGIESLTNKTITASGLITANASLNIANGATSAGILKLLEDTDDGTNFATFQVPALSANTVYTLPPDDGDSGEQLQTDGSGVLTWEAAGSGANTALSNLASVAINAALIPSSAGGLDFGSNTKPWKDIYFSGNSVVPSTNFYQITGASTFGQRTITFPDASITVAGLALADGGTNASLTASNGGIVYSTASAMAILSGTSTANKILMSGASNAPSWSTSTYPTSAGSSGNVLTSDGTNWTSSANFYTLQSQTAAGYSPADATVYYWGNISGAGTTSAIRRIYIPKTGTINAVYLTILNNGGTQGSTETNALIIRLNDTTDTTIISSINHNMASSTVSSFSGTGLTLAVTAGDYIEFKITTPTWTTNPTQIVYTATIFITVP